MSPRAACRLATIGFTDVYDYVEGKADWLARGLPIDGEKAKDPRAIDLVRDDAVICDVDERLAGVRERVRSSPYGFALVLSRNRVLLGRLHRAALETDDDATVGDVMEPGPSTVRADTPPASLLARLEKPHVKTAVVTDPDGVLLGIVRRSDLEARAAPATGAGGD